MINHLHWYGIAVGALLAVKLLLSIRRRRTTGPAWRDTGGAQHTVAAVITVYNEAPDMLTRCLRSLLAQTRRPQSVTVIDDCSTTHDAATVIRQLRREFEYAGVDLQFIRFPENRGKRHGLAEGFLQHPDADLYLCVDSDTVLDQHAVAELCAPFARRRVNCVTGLVLANNRAVNLLTRLIDMRYVNAFLGERVAYGRLGSVLCACGSLVVYRGRVIRRHLDDFLNQQFLGQPATFGDDRRLTYYCLTEGQSLIQPAAVAYTDVPQTLFHYSRQQVRWGKSFIREGFLLLGQLRHARRAFWWLNLIELTTWIAFTAGLITALTLVALHPANWPLLASYAGYVCAMAWLRSIHYLRGAANVPAVDRALTFLAAPLYALLNLFLLLPLRLYSLATLRRNGWGTRQRIEIPAAEELAVTHATPAAPAVLPDDDTVTIPLAKLYDPDSETTLQLSLPGR
ncbi:glycosyltransferase [Streptomyces sp. NPDC088353]|uniref:glycosyltransferase n=1 Tax=Streptomyces sp. NPDC088353 TaxID=3365855 RepID=UPI003804AA33